jgi:hypothetical protein
MIQVIAYTPDGRSVGKDITNFQISMSNSTNNLIEQKKQDLIKSICANYIEVSFSVYALDLKEAEQKYLEYQKVLQERYEQEIKGFPKLTKIMSTICDDCCECCDTEEEEHWGWEAKGSVYVEPKWKPSDIIFEVIEK